MSDREAPCLLGFLNPLKDKAVLVGVDHRGRWEIVVPGGRAKITCDTLDEARRMARRQAVALRPCEVLVHDAYHRVLQRELIG